MSYGASDEARTRNRYPTNSRWEFAGALPDLRLKSAHSAQVEVASFEHKEKGTQPSRLDALWSE